MKQISDMNSQVSKSYLLFDSIIEKLRLFLRQVYGDKFDQAYV